MFIALESKTDQRRRYLQSYPVAATQSEKRREGEKGTGQGCKHGDAEKREGQRRHSGNLDRCRVIKSRPPLSPLRLSTGSSPLVSPLSPCPSSPIVFLRHDRIRDVHVSSQNDRDISAFFFCLWQLLRIPPRIFNNGDSHLTEQRKRIYLILFSLNLCGFLTNYSLITFSFCLRDSVKVRKF